MSPGKFFHMHSRERSGAFLLLVIAVFLALFPRWYLGNKIPDRPSYSEDSVQIAQMMMELSEEKKQPFFRKYPKRIPSENDLLSWGFNRNAAKKINAHLTSGGSGDIKEISRLTGLDSVQIKKIFAQVQARNTESIYGPNHPLELNSSDSAGLISLKGIGAKTAHAILNYRNKLGGFYSKNQILELKWLDSATMQGLFPSLTLNQNLIQKIDVVHSSEQELARHPYINYKQAKQIKAFVTQHGGFEKTDLESHPGFSSAEKSRLSHYL